MSVQNFSSLAGLKVAKKFVDGGGFHLEYKQILYGIRKPRYKQIIKGY